jgi:hypothetical protein
MRLLHLAVVIHPALQVFGTGGSRNVKGSEYTVLLDGTQLYTNATNTVGYPGSSASRQFGLTADGSWAGYLFGMYQFTAKLTTDRASLITYLNTRLGTSFT